MAGKKPSKLTLSRQWMQTRESPVVLTKAFFGLKLSSWTSFFLVADLGFPLGQAILTSFPTSIRCDIKDTLVCQKFSESAWKTKLFCNFTYNLNRRRLFLQNRKGCVIITRELRLFTKKKLLIFAINNRTNISPKAQI